ncbi:UbiA family prenyltransferase [Haladaptatus litoreus]|uniref:UbiA family prenyltransferase n=1 Tax=Haladaptatus litoreus TaxID=553468 RepID=UPI0009712AC9|nr:UbiA family prenyltransferase [Haladaptatus litoreus]
MTHTEFFKGFPGVGTLLVSYLGGSTFLFGAAAVGRVSTPVIVLFLLAALSTFAREIIKDVESDREEGLNTLPITIGEQPALAMAIAVLLVTVVASPVTYVFGTFGVAYLVVVTPAILVTLYAGYLSDTDPTVGNHF